MNIKFWQNFKGQAELANLTVTVASLSQLKQIHRAALCWTNSILFVKANWPTRAPHSGCILQDLTDVGFATIQLQLAINLDKVVKEELALAVMVWQFSKTSLFSVGFSRELRI